MLRISRGAIIHEAEAALGHPLLFLVTLAPGRPWAVAGAEAVGLLVGLLVGAGSYKLNSVVATLRALGIAGTRATQRVALIGCSLKLPLHYPIRLLFVISAAWRRVENGFCL